MEEIITLKARSAKNKGKRLQNILRDKLIKLYPSLKDDISSQIMGMQGEDIVLTPHAKATLPYSFECKNVERLQFWATVEQAESNLKENTYPAIVVKKNRKTPYVAIELDHFLELIGGNND